VLGVAEWVFRRGSGGVTREDDTCLPVIPVISSVVALLSSIILYGDLSLVIDEWTGLRLAQSSVLASNLGTGTVRVTLRALDICSDQRPTNIEDKLVVVLVHHVIVVLVSSQLGQAVDVVVLADLAQHLVLTGKLGQEIDKSKTSGMSLDIVFLGFGFIVAGGCKVPDVGTIEVDLSHNLLSILTNLAISVVEVQLAILNDQFIVGHPKLGPVGSTDASLGPTLAVDKRSTDVELVGTRNMTIDSGPFVVGVVSLEAAEVVGEARVGVGHAAASVTCWRDGTRSRVTPSEQIFTIGGVDQLRLRLRHVVSTFKVEFGLNMGPITGRIRANGAQFVFQVDLTITGVNPKARLTWNHLTQVLLNHLTSRGLDKTCSSMVGTVGLGMNN